MRIDMHCHASGKGRRLAEADREPFLGVEADPNPLLRGTYRWLYSYMEKKLIKLGEYHGLRELQTDHYYDILFRQLRDAREIDAIVLLAFDAVYDQHGKIDERSTTLFIINRWLVQKIKQLNQRLQEAGATGKRFLMGASVSPNRPDWREELDWAINQEETVLLKWIPSVQRIRLDQVSEAFYGHLAAANLPLLCHVAKEHTFPDGLRYPALDNYELLKRPLELGVKIIAAHCNTPTLPFEKNRIQPFLRFMEQTNRNQTRIWSDTSALTSVMKSRFMKEVARSFDPDWLVHGSDFPLPVDAKAFFGRIPQADYAQLRKEKNYFDLDARIKRSYGFADSILNNAEKVLRIT